MKILAMDFGGTSVKYSVIDENGQGYLWGKEPAPLDSREQFTETVYSIYKKHGHMCDGISISIPGYVNSDTGYLSGSGAYRALYACNISELLRSVIPVHIAVENDGRCGALAEVWKGALSDSDDGVVLILGSGIAGGIMKDRKIHRGYHATAGEFSNYLVNPVEPSFAGLAVMNCASFGLTYKLCKYKNLDLDCQDYSAELKGMDASFGNRYPVFTETPGRIKADGKQLYKWIREKDPVSIQIYREFIRSLAFMIFNIQITCDPSKIVLGGGLCKIPCLVKDAKKELEKLYSGTGIGKELQTELIGSSFDEKCNLFGAVYNYLLHY